MSEELKVVGTCPLCGSDVVEKEKLFSCSAGSSRKDEETEEWINEGCQYKIFKGAMKRFGKEEVTASEVEELLKNGEVEVELISQKSGKPYNAKAVTDEKWGVQIKFDFDKKEDK
jgi:hypothetical protein